MSIKAADIQEGDWVKIESPGLSDWFEVTEIVTKHPPNVASMKPLPILFSGMIEIPKDDITAHRNRFHTEGSPFRKGDLLAVGKEQHITKRVADNRAWFSRLGGVYHANLQSCTLVKPVEAIEAEREAVEDCPAWVSRMEKATDSTGYTCSGFEANSIAAEWRKLKAIEAERKKQPEPDKPRLTPVMGPPDLDGVPDDALFAYGWTGSDGTRYTNCKNAKAMKMVVSQVGDELDWHIPLGVIEEPKPGPQKIPPMPYDWGDDDECKTENGTVTLTYDEETCKAVLEANGYTVTKLTESDKPCPNDTNGDGDCGRKYCPYCGEPFPVREPEVTLEDYIRERCGGFLRYYRDPEWAVIADEIQRKFIK